MSSVPACFAGHQCTRIHQSGDKGEIAGKSLELRNNKLRLVLPAKEQTAIRNKD
jgi:hypothetical protein